MENTPPTLSTNGAKIPPTLETAPPILETDPSITLTTEPRAFSSLGDILLSFASFMSSKSISGTPKIFGQYPKESEILILKLLDAFLKCSGILVKMSPKR